MYRIKVTVDKPALTVPGIRMYTPIFSLILQLFREDIEMCAETHVNPDVKCPLT